jgi:hypothetical protein
VRTAFGIRVVFVLREGDVAAAATTRALTTMTATEQGGRRRAGCDGGTDNLPDAHEDELQRLGVADEGQDAGT